MFTIKKTVFFCLLLCFANKLVAVPAVVNPNLKTINISAGEWPPFLGESLPYQGVVAHLIRDIFAQAGIQVHFTFLPWGRAYHDTNNGKYDATAVWMHSKDRTNAYLFSNAVLSEQFVFFHLKKNDFDWRDLNDLRGLIIGGGLNYSYGPVFDQAIEKNTFELSRVSSTEQNFRRLSVGRIDIFAEEKNVGYYTLNNQHPELADTITHHPTAFLTNESFVLFPKNTEQSEQLLTTFNHYLLQFKQDGRYQAYFEGLQKGDYQLAK
ncbi:transporter substrate-binding domain-containing protein [Pseudoalteromonas shioyasakiensis]|uniref:substrate-binding periplasmic protein n=1 Tax=Pseudoalteromonas shioyasakiensis TaxID=1190813 RepID=UPI002117392A|nr:transporter substrate-binding domain-containing protein [Pseudoalteromonas shioyasakiensis]MCQ8878007.1 transporter substrate-binding domain-containing protein [Pseudoalteromonas shioyasakiensis]